MYIFVMEIHKTNMAESHQRDKLHFDVKTQIILLLNFNKQ